MLVVGIDDVGSLQFRRRTWDCDDIENGAGFGDERRGDAKAAGVSVTPEVGVPREATLRSTCALIAPLQIVRLLLCPRGFKDLSPPPSPHYSPISVFAVQQVWRGFK